MKKRALAVTAVVLGLLATLLVPAPPAAAWYCISPDAIKGLGAADQLDLQYGYYIPELERLCPSAANKVVFAEQPEVDAIIQFQNMRVLFLGLNQPLSSADWTIATTSRNSPGSNTGFVNHLPLMVQGFVVTTNLSSCPTPTGGVRLTPKTLSLIYSGVIKTWGDPLIANDQSTDVLDNCTERISVGIRDGAAWSTAVLKDYMSKQNPAFEALKQRELLTLWPSLLDIDCRGFSDLGMRACGRNAGGISYMPYRTAKLGGLDIARIQNGAGNYTQPASGGALHPTNCNAAVPDPVLATTPTAARPEYLPPTTADWSRVSLVYGKKGYGLCAFHYVVTNQGVRGSYFEPGEVQTLHDLLTVMWSDNMQAELPALGFLPLPEEPLKMVRTAITAVRTA